MLIIFFRRLEDSKNERKDFIYYILKQAEHYDLSQDEVIVNAALFMYVSGTGQRLLSADTFVTASQGVKQLPVLSQRLRTIFFDIQMFTKSLNRRFEAPSHQRAK